MQVVSPPGTPVISAPASLKPATSGTASVPARADQTYAWVLTGATSTSPGGLSGVTADGTNHLDFK